MVGHHPTNKLIGREPIPHQKHPKAQSFPHPPCSRRRISRISHTFMRLSRRRGQVTHVLLTRSPLIQDPQKQAPSPFDLHVLSTPPAFVLSQDQTLQTKPTKPGPNQPQTASQNPQSVQQSRKPDQAQPNPKHRARQTKTKQTPKTTHKHAQPPGPWHKKHDTLSSSQTTHPPRFQLGIIPSLPLEGDRTSISRLSFGNQIRIA